MPEDIKVSPTPIQRNYNDVAFELTELYYKRNAPASEEELQKTYIKMYAVAFEAGHGKIDLQKYLQK